MAEITLLTKKGLKDLQDEYDKLVHEVRDEVKEELRAARAQGDLSENADYDAARDRQAQVEARIAQVEQMLHNYQLIDEKDKGSNTVKIGTTVTLEFQDTGKTETYSIVGSTEADPFNGKLSNETPLAKAIIDRKVGTTCTVNVKNPYKVKIVEVKVIDFE
ncbi:MAG: transcription elongation factor GreA [Erysipelotrichaceae bacterium]|nr:transcription elongation factor GreA [Erysipelotrichaceae bacterium]